MMVYRPPTADGWKILDGDAEDEGRLFLSFDSQNISGTLTSSADDAVSGAKRRLEFSATDESSSKRARIAADASKSPCLAPFKKLARSSYS